MLNLTVKKISACLMFLKNASSVIKYLTIYKYHSTKEMLDYANY